MWQQRCQRGGLGWRESLPDMVALRQRFAPDPATLPNITVLISPLTDYNPLLAAVPTGEAA